LDSEGGVTIVDSEDGEVIDKVTGDGVIHLAAYEEIFRSACQSRDRAIENDSYTEFLTAVALGFKRQFTIDKTPFNASMDSVPLANKDRSGQKITFDAAYGGERMSAYLYLPTNTMPPYQSVVYFPGAGAIWNPLFDPANGSELPWVDFVLKSGRAVIYPILKGTHERNDGLKNSSPENSVKYRDYVLMWVKDIIRSVDYLETRADIDTSRLAYYGFSWGARLGGIVLAVDSRFKAAVLASGGLDIHKPQEEVAVVNYLPRVKTPVRMLNGRHDICCFPVESSQKPFFKMLGTDREDKEHIIFEDVAHLPSRANLIKGTLDWYDKYLESQVSCKGN